jgi:putative endonuclease
VKNNTFGKWVEDQACRYLEAKGCQILDRRVHFRVGEIDVIAVSEDGLLFVEVKGRRSRKFGNVVESLTRQKVQRLKKAVIRWRMQSRDRRPGRLMFLGVFEDQEGRLTMEEYFIE